MAIPAGLTTVLSTKGQIILPKSVREHRRWNAGTRLIVEETADGVLLRVAPLFGRTDLDAVFGILESATPARSVEQMDDGVSAEARRRHDRD